MFKVYTDAAVKGNPGIAGVGILIIGEEMHEQLSIPLKGDWNNHLAEWEAVKIGLQWLIEHNKTENLTFIYTDSKIVANSINKNYVKNDEFKNYLTEICQLMEDFNVAELSWIPEKENKGADNLAKQGLRKAEKQSRN